MHRNRAPAAFFRDNPLARSGDCRRYATTTTCYPLTSVPCCGLSKPRATMTENPYQSSSNTTSEKPPTRSTRWLVRSGIASLAVAFACFVATLVGMLRAFNSIASSTTAPKPSDLAQGISVASIPSIAVVPLATLGVILIIAGLIIRQQSLD